MELARLFRTPRWLGLTASYVVFGVLMPVVTRYQEALFRSMGGDIKIEAPPPTPPAAIAAFVGNAAQIGLLVTIFVAAGSLAFDARPEWAAFLRTRAPVGRLLVPKVSVNAAASAASFAIGGVAAWIGTTVLIGDLPAAGMVAGIAYWCLYLAFAVSVVALAAGLARSVIGTAGITVVVLLALPLGAQVVGAAEPWMPSVLVGAISEIADGAAPADYLRAAAATAPATGVCLLAARRLLERREV
jgi:hypothetical protein